MVCVSMLVGYMRGEQDGTGSQVNDLANVTPPTRRRGRSPAIAMKMPPPGKRDDRPGLAGVPESLSREGDTPHRLET